MNIIILLLFIRAISALRCFNFYGLETPRYALVCDWKHEPVYYLDIMKSTMGVDTIRLPFSRENVMKNDFHYMDNFIYDCYTRNIDIILDYHRTWSDHQGPTPEERITIQQFVETWIILAYRYSESKNVMGLDIFNEYQGSNSSYIINVQNMVIEAVEGQLPGRYVYFVGCINWGTDCRDFNLSQYNVKPDRVFITIHKYIFAGGSDWDLAIPEEVPASQWFVGEVGWRQNNAKERNWAESFLGYLANRGIHNVCAWTVAHSGDTDGWWGDDCETFDVDKSHLLTSVWEEW